MEAEIEEIRGEIHEITDLAKEMRVALDKTVIAESGCGHEKRYGMCDGGIWMQIR